MTPHNPDPHPQTRRIDRLLIGTTSAHKAAEIREILAAAGLAELPVLTLGDLPARPAEPHESGRTFLANATLKAQAYARVARLWTLADDSGLCVDALNGEPGIDSAYYAGLPRDDARNNHKLLADLACVDQAERGARFVCVMVLCDPAGEVQATSEGVVRGRILAEARGESGFGYDPLFALVPQDGVLAQEVGYTIAELPTAAKNRVSHRGRAMRAMAEQIRTL